MRNTKDRSIERYDALIPILGRHLHSRPFLSSEMNIFLVDQDSVNPTLRFYAANCSRLIRMYFTLFYPCIPPSTRSLKTRPRIHLRFLSSLILDWQSGTGEGSTRLQPTPPPNRVHQRTLSLNFLG